jgi:ribonucleotide monophosphatase NagD (HAD superfamily)
MNVLRKSMVLIFLGYALRELKSQNNKVHFLSNEATKDKKSEVFAARVGSVVEDGIRKSLGRMETYLNK